MQGLETHCDLPRDATQEEIDSLLHEVADIPRTAWLLSFTGAAAQFARFGITITWRQSKASIIQNAYLFFQYLTPLQFAILSDMWIGRYKTMIISLSLLILGYIVLFATALPGALDHGAGLGGLVAAMILSGLGQGGLSTDQIPTTRSQVKRGNNGALVVTDRQLAVQYVFNGYYCFYSSSIVAETACRGPCYRYPLECAAAANTTTRREAITIDETRPNEVNVWIQTPLHFLLATGEILGIVSLNEYTQHEAPISTKAMVRALQEIAAAAAAALGIGLGPVSKNPYLTILFATLAGTMVSSAVLFWLAFRKYDLEYDVGNKEAEGSDPEGTKNAPAKTME
ncbi:hypothetical protein CHU98_g3704 [Xylaria longipes]|nr:hypothetical protein CHU98_g3704 [Xylaria longipes]